MHIMKNKSKARKWSGDIIPKSLCGVKLEVCGSIPNLGAVSLQDELQAKVDNVLYTLYLSSTIQVNTYHAYYYGNQCNL